jgi:hypothetical protein
VGGVVATKLTAKQVAHVPPFAYAEEVHGLSSQWVAIPRSTPVIATLSRHHASLLCEHRVTFCDCAYCASCIKSVCEFTPPSVGTKASVVVVLSANFA